MGFLSSLFGKQPDWLRSLPAWLQFKDKDLITELEQLRESLGAEHEEFQGLIICSRTASIKSIRFAYTEAKRGMPGRPETEYLGMIIGDRMAKKMISLPYNTAPNAMTEDEITAVTDNLEAVAIRCKTFDGTVRYLMELEEGERADLDPFMIISNIDSICSKYASA